MSGVLDNSGVLDALERSEVDRLVKHPEEAQRFLISSVAALNKEAGRARDDCKIGCRPQFDARITTVETAVKGLNSLVDTVKAIGWTAAKAGSIVLAILGTILAVLECIK